MSKREPCDEGPDAAHGSHWRGYPSQAANAEHTESRGNEAKNGELIEQDDPA
jgi:hypothetical protein